MRTREPLPKTQLPDELGPSHAPDSSALQNAMSSCCAARTPRVRYFRSCGTASRVADTLAQRVPAANSARAVTVRNSGYAHPAIAAHGGAAREIADLHRIGAAAHFQGQ